MCVGEGAGVIRVGAREMSKEGVRRLLCYECIGYMYQG